MFSTIISMLKKLFSTLLDCPLAPLYLLFGLFSQSRSFNLTSVDDLLLSQIFTKYQSDKSSLHSYDFAYTRIFSAIRFDSLNILEIGIGSNNTSIPFNMGAQGSVGASLYSWCDYFPNSLIYGADIDPCCMFDAPRIQTSLCNQLSSASIRHMASSFSQEKGKEFIDVCIDDGYHSFGANRRTFLALRTSLRSQYKYIIEDVSPWMFLAWKGFALVHSVDVTIYQFPSSKQPLLMVLITH